VAERQYNGVLTNFDDSKEMVQNGFVPPLLRGRLLYSFKTFGKEFSCPEPVDEVPPSGQSAALRFINHLKSDETSKILFNDNSEISLESNDNFGSIEQEMLNSLHSNQKNHGDTQRPYSKSHWWVLGTCSFGSCRRYRTPLLFTDTARIPRCSVS
jgi:hypothetical protein